VHNLLLSFPFQPQRQARNYTTDIPINKFKEGERQTGTKRKKYAIEAGRIRITTSV
jgi:hypothetical protein